MRCPSCQVENPEAARFCMACATELVAPSPTREVRKTVTIVFCDVSGSTSLGERLDPESLRQVMGRYFDAMAAVIERHGGTVEKFIGDAVMSVFGVPVVREDDALRAVRAAADMSEALVGLNEEFETTRGVRIDVRTGVNTGEVVAAEGNPGGQRLATGDAINVAARLEQAAEPGTILIGATTYRLVRSAVHVEPIDPLSLKGKAEPIQAYRLISVYPAAVAGTARTHDSALVGRERELALLEDALGRAIADRTCHLFTVLGVAGVGKSRLLADVLERRGQSVDVLTGRCLPYGDGITFWPVLEMLKEAAGIQEPDAPEVVRTKVTSLVEQAPQAEAIAAQLTSLLGLSAGSGTLEEALWAIRSLLETLARRRPLIVVIDDLQWGEPVLLELIEQIADWARDAPILLVCLARPELLEARPMWGGGKMNATTVLLEPLSEAESDELAHRLLGRSGLDPAVQRRVTESAGGNPLFVEEMVSMLVDDGIVVERDGRWVATSDLRDLSVPPTIHALLAARLDRLEPGEWSVVEGASVIGQEFDRASVSALAPESLRPDVSTYLRSLVRKDLVRPDPDVTSRDDAFRFRHILIRDAAYQAMPKQTRAELHERFADWLERTAGERVAEFQEIIGYHLEQALRYRTELGTPVADSVATRDRAAAALGAAGRRAYARGDMRAATSLLNRAASLLPFDDDRRLELLPELSEALAESGRREEGLQLLDEAIRTSPVPRIRAHLVLARQEIDLEVETAEDADRRYEREATEALTAFEAARDARGLSVAWRALGFVAWERGQIELSIDRWEKAARYAGDIGDRGREAHDRAWILIAHGFSRMPATEALSLAQAALPLVADIPAAHAEVLWEVAGNHAMLGEFAEAWKALDQSKAIERDLGRGLTASHYVVQIEEEIARLAGDQDRRIHALRQALDDHQRISGSLDALLAARLALALAEVGQDDEAWAMAEASRAEARGHMHVIISILPAEALVLAHRDVPGDARKRAQQAVDLVGGTEFFWGTGDALVILGDVRRLAGDRAASRTAYQRALAIYEAKGILPLVARTRAQLAIVEHG